MLIVRTYRCEAEDCGKQFELYQDSSEGPPKFCPGCGAEFDQDAEPIPGTRAIGGSALARSTDSTYRQLEESSAARAAELGAPSLKVTNLADNLREGDVAAKAPPQNAVTWFDGQMKRDPQYGGRGMIGWGGGFAGPIGPSTRGNTPGPGAVALSATQPEHAARVQQSVQSTNYQPYAAGVGAKLPRSR